MPDEIYASEIVALILESNSMPVRYIENNPYIIMKKALTGGYIIVYVKEEDVDKVIANVDNYSSNIYPLVMGLLGEAQLTASGITQVHRQPFLHLRGQGVLLGFVDTGIDYTQSAFRYEDGSSRIACIWDQTISGNPPGGFHYGSEYNNQDISRALASSNPHGVVPHVDSVGHGTFLASVAASRQEGTYMGAAPDSELVVVKLRRARKFDYRRFLIPPEQENAFSSADFMMGVQYIVDKAHELGRPVAICVSLGTNLGPHDGTGNLEGYLSRVSGISGTAVCTAAGNEAQAGHHTHDKLAATGDVKNIEFRAGGKHEDIYLSLFNSAADRLSVALKSPTGETVSRMPARSGARYTQKLVLERASVTVEYVFPVGRRGEQLTRIKIISATPGIWTISVYGDSILDGQFHIWLPLTGFIDPQTVFLNPTPNYTVVLPATSSGVITCGSYNSQDNSLSPTSSWGPSRLPAQLPDLTAPGEHVDGIFPTGYGEMSGTSVAAAITAGASALMLQWAIVEGNDTSMDSHRIRANLIAGCERDPGVDYPNNQWGYGRLNLYNTFRSLRPY